MRIRTMASLLSAAALAASLSIALAATGHADPLRRRPRVRLRRPGLQIANADNELCIGFQNDVFGSVGERLVLKSCFQTSGWELVPENANGTNPLFELQASGSDNLCMAAANTIDNNGAPLVALPCDGFQDAGQILQLG